MRRQFLNLLLLTYPILLVGQTDPYVFRTFAGSEPPLGDGGPATQAYLRNPNAVAVDAAGNTFILDANNLRIRKVDPAGVISTVVTLNRFCTDMALGRDGSFYLASTGLIFRVSPAGTVTSLAGTGTFGAEGGDGLATTILVGSTSGIALDGEGNVYWAESSRVRKVTMSTGLVTTVAGTAGSFAYNGDNRPATSAFLWNPSGLAVDGQGNLYIADASNRRIRKVTNGTIQTIAGNGGFARPNDTALASTSPIGVVQRLTVDHDGVVYFTDSSNQFVMKILPIPGTTLATINWVAGSAVSRGLADGPALSSNLLSPVGLALTPSGDVVVAESGTNRVRRVSGNNLTTIAGRFRFGGDGGPAVSAVLSSPSTVTVDSEGNVYVADSQNYRIRKIDRRGIITTVIGNGNPFPLAEGIGGATTSLGTMTALAVDRASNLLLAVGLRLYKVTPFGQVSLVAGTGINSDAGDGGPAVSAVFRSISALAVDREGNIFVADSQANRVRKISASDSKIFAFAGSGVRGFSGDGGLATGATLAGVSALGVDSVGSVYISDTANYRIRMVTPSGLISTIAGNGTFGAPLDEAQSRGAPFFNPSGMVFDSSGNLFVSSSNFSFTFKVEPSGIVRRISGGGSVPPADGVLATSAQGFTSGGIAIDSSGDLYLPQSFAGVVYKLVRNSVSDFRASGGSNQSGPVGSSLSQALRVTVAGRAGIGVAGAVVSFVVTSGTATLSVSNVRTDAAGVAGVGVTPGSSGPIVVKATLASSDLPAVEFRLTGTQSAEPGCALSPPSLTSAKSAGDFGGLPNFASGSWLEIKGTTLSANTRSWGGNDFDGSNAPVVLDGTRVTINGSPAFVAYISPTQVNVQAPADAQTGPAEIKLTTCAGSSAAFILEKAIRAPGLLTPAAFNIQGKQYLVALHQDGVTFVGATGLIAGVPFRPAKPGDAITTYGIGFGLVTPAIPPGVVATEANALASLTISLGNVLAPVGYAGLAPGNIGLYQFNFTIPDVPDGDYTVPFTLSGVRIPQTVYLTVAR